jgi:hypothetical protein
MAAASYRPALRSLAGIVDLPVRVGAVGRRAHARPDSFVSELESLVVSSGLGGAADNDAMLACALWLLGQDESSLAALHAIAVRDGHAIVAAILADAAPHRGLAPGGRLSPLDIPETARVARHVFTWGDTHDHYLIGGIHYDPIPAAPRPPRRFARLETMAEYEQYFATLLEQIAAGVRAPFSWKPMHPLAVRRAVTRLGKHHSPIAIGRLLDDPATRERDVVAIAARRPTTPAIVVTARRPAVRMTFHSEERAIGVGPFLVPRIALRGRRRDRCITASFHAPRCGCPARSTKSR